MRIVSGTHRGRTITPPATFKARPTTDFAKENLFNILINRYDFEDISLLDLFSGTGSISFEAASRGAKRIVSVEMNPTHQRFISSTARDMGFAAILSVKTNALVYLKSSVTEKFDIIFADPPYDMAGAESIPQIILNKGILNSGGVLVFEHSGAVDFSHDVGFQSTKRYGSVHFTFFGSSQ